LTETPVVGPDIIEIQPCTEEGLVTLEAKLGGKADAEFFDPALLCRYINASPAFTRQRCSAEMGYGVAERSGRNVHAFKTGKVIVRRAEGREMALEHLRLISRSLWPALKVRGGEALVVCLASEAGCPAFPAPPADGGELAVGRSFSEAIEEARELPRWNLIAEGLAQLRAIAAAFPRSGVTKATKEQFKNAEGKFLGFVVETEDVKKAAVGIPFLAASLLLDMAMKDCQMLAPDAKAAFWALAMEAFEAAVTGSDAEASGLRAKLMAEAVKSNANPTALDKLLRIISGRLP
jgi:hypothetical protein